MEHVLRSRKKKVIHCWHPVEAPAPLSWSLSLFNCCHVCVMQFSFHELLFRDVIVKLLVTDTNSQAYVDFTSVTKVRPCV
jgi:hypothetical protein